MRFWYARSKKIDGKPYAPATLICMRAAINRYLNSSTWDRQVKLMEDKEFKSSNNTLTAMIAQYLQNNEKDNKSFKAIDKEDLKKLSDYFDRSTPVVLQQEVFYLIIYHFGYKGREWLRGITKDSVKIHADDNGKTYVDLLRSTEEKNVRPSTSRRHFESIKTILMYATPDNPEKCPVAAVQFYLSKLPTTTSVLFPKPKPKSNLNDG